MTQQQKTYTIENQAAFPYLTSIKNFKEIKQKAQKQKKWTNFMIKQSPLITKWFNFLSPEFILVQIDQNAKTVKYYEKHQKVINQLKISPRFIEQQMAINQIRNFNQKLQMSLRKNFINGKKSPQFSYNWLTFKDEQAEKPKLSRVVKAGVKFDIDKWLSNTLRTTEKKIFVSCQKIANIYFLPFSLISANLHIANRQNSYQVDQKSKIIGEKCVKQNSDIVGYHLKLQNQTFGYELSFKGGYDHFQKYRFNKVLFKYLNFKEFQNHVIEASLRGGAVFGKNLMQNDLLNRNKGRWVDDRSLNYLNPRVNFILKNISPNIAGVLQIVPFFYLEGWASKNKLQIKTKYELDYGIGVRFLNIGFQFDYSLLRIGKNLDDINSSIRFVF